MSASGGGAWGGEPVYNHPKTEYRNYGIFVLLIV
jgi:hypothetical protein